MLLIHKRKCENYGITTIRTSSESHLPWKDHFQRNSICFRIYADFEADNEIDNFSIETKQLILVNKTQYLMVITYYLNLKVF